MGNTNCYPNTPKDFQCGIFQNQINDSVLSQQPKFDEFVKHNENLNSSSEEEETTAIKGTPAYKTIKTKTFQAKNYDTNQPKNQKKRLGLKAFKKPPPLQDFDSPNDIITDTLKNLQNQDISPNNNGDLAETNLKTNIYRSPSKSYMDCEPYSPAKEIKVLECITNTLGRTQLPETIKPSSYNNKNAKMHDNGEIHNERNFIHINDKENIKMQQDNKVINPRVTSHSIYNNLGTNNSAIGDNYRKLTEFSSNITTHASLFTSKYPDDQYDMKLDYQDIKSSAEGVVSCKFDEKKIESIISKVANNDSYKLSKNRLLDERNDEHHSYYLNLNNYLNQKCNAIQNESFYRKEHILITDSNENTIKFNNPQQLLIHNQQSNIIDPSQTMNAVYNASLCKIRINESGLSEENSKEYEINKTRFYNETEHWDVNKTYNERLSHFDGTEKDISTIKYSEKTHFIPSTGYEDHIKMINNNDYSNSIILGIDPPNNTNSTLNLFEKNSVKKQDTEKTENLFEFNSGDMASQNLYSNPKKYDDLLNSQTSDTKLVTKIKYPDVFSGINKENEKPQYLFPGRILEHSSKISMHKNSQEYSRESADLINQLPSFQKSLNEASHDEKFSKIETNHVHDNLGLGLSDYLSNTYNLNSKESSSYLSKSKTRKEINPVNTIQYSEEPATLKTSASTPLLTNKAIMDQNDLDNQRHHSITNIEFLKSSNSTSTLLQIPTINYHIENTCSNKNNVNSNKFYKIAKNIKELKNSGFYIKNLLPNPRGTRSKQINLNFGLDTKRSSTRLYSHNSCEKFETLDHRSRIKIDKEHIGHNESLKSPDTQKDSFKYSINYQSYNSDSNFNISKSNLTYKHKDQSNYEPKNPAMHAIYSDKDQQTNDIQDSITEISMDIASHSSDMHDAKDYINIDGKLPNIKINSMFDTSSSTKNTKLLNFPQCNSNELHHRFNYPSKNFNIDQPNEINISGSNDQDINSIDFKYNTFNQQAITSNDNPQLEFHFPIDRTNSKHLKEDIRCLNTLSQNITPLYLKEKMMEANFGRIMVPNSNSNLKILANDIPENIKLSHNAAIKHSLTILNQNQSDLYDKVVPYSKTESNGIDQKLKRNIDFDNKYHKFNQNIILNDSHQREVLNDYCAKNINNLDMQQQTGYFIGNIYNIESLNNHLPLDSNNNNSNVSLSIDHAQLKSEESGQCESILRNNTLINLDIHNDSNNCPKSKLMSEYHDINIKQNISKHKVDDLESNKENIQRLQDIEISEKPDNSNSFNQIKSQANSNYTIFKSNSNKLINSHSFKNNLHQNDFSEILTTISKADTINYRNNYDITCKNSNDLYHVIQNKTPQNQTKSVSNLGQSSGSALDSYSNLYAHSIMANSLHKNINGSRLSKLSDLSAFDHNTNNQQYDSSWAKIKPLIEKNEIINARDNIDGTRSQLAKIDTVEDYPFERLATACNRECVEAIEDINSSILSTKNVCDMNQKIIKMTMIVTMQSGFHMKNFGTNGLKTDLPNNNAIGVLDNLATSDSILISTDTEAKIYSIKKEIRKLATNQYFNPFASDKYQLNNMMNIYAKHNPDTHLDGNRNEGIKRNNDHDDHISNDIQNKKYIYSKDQLNKLMDGLVSNLHQIILSLVMWLKTIYLDYCLILNKIKLIFNDIIWMLIKEAKMMNYTAMIRNMKLNYVSFFRTENLHCIFNNTYEHSIISSIFMRTNDSSISIRKGLNSSAIPDFEKNYRERQQKILASVIADVIEFFDHDTDCIITHEKFI